MYICRCIYIHMYACTYVCISKYYVHIPIYVYMQVNICIYTDASICICIYIYACLYAHMFSCLCAQFCTPPEACRRARASLGTADMGGRAATMATSDTACTHNGRILYRVLFEKNASSRTVFFDKVAKLSRQVGGARGPSMWT